MKRVLLLIAFLASAFISRAQSIQALADSSFAHQEYVKAYGYYTQALKTEPKNVIYLRRAGFSLMNCKGQELNATRFFADAIKLQPKDAVSNYYLGLIYLDAAKQTGSIKEKANFKALAETYLKNASLYGSNEANAALSDLNGI
jgi:hypothetical protein